MIYAGDTHTFLLSISHADGTTPDVTSAPIITVIRPNDGVTVVSSQAMTLVTGTVKIYKYVWNTVGATDGDHLAVVSYAADSHTFNGQYLDRVRLGDSRVTGSVALDATVAHDATVAKDSTVAHLSDLTGINPNTSTAVLAIKAKTDTLPTNPANQDTLTSVVSLLTDVHNVSLGTWIIDKTQNPKVLSLRRLDGTTLATFAVTEDTTSAARTKIT